MKPQFAIAIHGGAGTILKSSLSPEQESLYRAKLSLAIETGYSILERGGTSLDAVEAVVQLLEDDSLFNAGKGAVFNSDGKVELDASIMNGRTLKAGAVAGLHHVKNPIRLARAVMEKSEHVFLIGEGAEQFAKAHNLELVDESYFFTESRWRSLQKAKAKESLTEKEKHGTVGAVALDQFGNLAAATSTGGMTNKKFGRIGDSPIIGAGTYADNETCAVSATGHGEYFIRAVVAHDIASLIRYKHLSLQAAANEVIGKLTKLGGTGGIIAIDRNANIAMPFNTEGMYRGYKVQGEKTFIAIYKEEKNHEWRAIKNE